MFSYKAEIIQTITIKNNAANRSAIENGLQGTYRINFNFITFSMYDNCVPNLYE